MYTVGGNNQPALGCINCGQPVQMGDLLAIDVEAVTFCKGQKMDGDTYQMGSCVTWYEANKRAQADFPGSPYNPLRWSGAILWQSYTYTDVNTVVNMYVSLASTSQIPEYGKPDDTNRSLSEQAIKALVANLPHFDEKFIRVVMYNLEQAVHASAVAPMVLYPASIKDPSNPPANMTNIVNSYTDAIKKQAAVDNQPSLLDQIGSGLKTAALLGILGLTIWGGTKVFSSYEDAKGK